VGLLHVVSWFDPKLRRNLEKTDRMILGNYLPNLRPNYFIGIRTPWTFENAETWRATHRLGGRLMFYGALLLLILEFFVSPSNSGVLLMIFVLLLVVWALLYSWHHYRTHGTTTH
jgi:immunity protein, SdpI family